MKTILVTGGNRGIGFEICRQLDVPGNTVILCSRDLEKGKAAAATLSKNVVVRQLDVTSEYSIEALFGHVEADFGKLDVLVNNAGVGSNYKKQENPIIGGVKKVIETHVPGVGKAVRTTGSLLRKAGLFPEKNVSSVAPLEIVREIMEINFYGPWRMIQAFIPLLEKSGDPRIINMSSGMGELKNLDGKYPGYRLSKASLNMLTIMFSNELKDRGIKVNAMCPGWVRTDMGGPNAPRSVSQGADTAVWLATETVVTGKFFRDRSEINW